MISSVRLGRVNHHQQTMLPGQFPDSVYSAGNSGIIDWQQHFGPFCNQRLHVANIGVHGYRVNLAKHWLGSGHHHRVGCGTECVGWQYHLITGPQAGQPGAHFQSRSAGGDQKDVLQLMPVPNMLLYPFGELVVAG